VNTFCEENKEAYTKHVGCKIASEHTLDEENKEAYTKHVGCKIALEHINAESTVLQVNKTAGSKRKGNIGGMLLLYCNLHQNQVFLEIPSHPRCKPH
jgi:hypothetical protein